MSDFGNPALLDLHVVELQLADGRSVVFPAGSIPTYIVEINKSKSCVTFLAPVARADFEVEGTPREIFEVFRQGMCALHQVPDVLYEAQEIAEPIAFRAPKLKPLDDPRLEEEPDAP